MFHTDMIRRNVKNTLRPLQHICQMTEHIFHTLLCLIRHIGEQSKSRNIYEKVIVEHSDITRKRHSVHNRIRRFQHIFWNMQAACKIIGRPRRYITDRNHFFSAAHPCYDLIQRTVASAACNQVVRFGIRDRFCQRIMIFLRRINGHFIPAFHKNIQNIRQVRLQHSRSCIRIINKQHFFSSVLILIRVFLYHILHFSSSLMSHILLFSRLAIFSFVCNEPFLRKNVIFRIQTDGLFHL